MRRFIARLALLTSLGVVVVFAGDASGTAGDPLLIGSTSNDAGTSNTKLITVSGAYGLWVAQGGTGAGFKATTGAIGGDAVFASTANPATSAVHGINTAGGSAARFEGNVSVSGVPVPVELAATTAWPWLVLPDDTPAPPAPPLPVAGLGEHAGDEASRNTAGHLRRILRDHEPAPAPVHLLLQSSGLASPKIRVCADFLVQQLHRSDALGQHLEKVRSAQ